MGRLAWRDGLVVFGPAIGLLVLVGCFFVAADFVDQFRSSRQILDVIGEPNGFRELSLRQQAIQQRATLYTLMGGAAAGLVGLYFVLWRTRIAEEQKQIAEQHKKLADKQRATDLIAKASEKLGALRENGEISTEVSSETVEEKPGEYAKPSAPSADRKLSEDESAIDPNQSHKPDETGSGRRGSIKTTTVDSTNTTRKLYSVVEEERRAAILLLEQVGREDNDLTNDIKNLLAAYVRSESDTVYTTLKKGEPEFTKRRRLMRAAIRSIGKLEEKRPRDAGSLTSLRSVILEEERLWELSFRNCDLSNASFVRCIIIRGSFDGADLSQARFFETDIQDADFSGAINLTQAQVDGFRGKQGNTRLPPGLFWPEDEEVIPSAIDQDAP